MPDLEIAGAAAIPARSADDPDGARCAAALSAHVRAEQQRSFRRLLWPRVIALAFLWAAGAAAFLSQSALWLGFGSIVAVAFTLAAAAR